MPSECHHNAQMTSWQKKVCYKLFKLQTEPTSITCTNVSQVQILLKREFDSDFSIFCSRMNIIYSNYWSEIFRKHKTNFFLIKFFSGGEVGGGILQNLRAEFQIT